MPSQIGSFSDLAPVTSLRVSTWTHGRSWDSSPSALSPEAGFPGTHIYVTDGTVAFDFHGYSAETHLLRYYWRDWAARYPGWEATFKSSIFRFWTPPRLTHAVISGRTNMPTMFWSGSGGSWRNATTPWVMPKRVKHRPPANLERVARDLPDPACTTQKDVAPSMPRTAHRGRGAVTGH